MLKFISPLSNNQQYITLIFPPKSKTTTIIDSLSNLAQELKIDTTTYPGHPLSEQVLLNTSFRGKSAASRYGLEQYFVSTKSLSFTGNHNSIKNFKTITDNIHGTGSKFNLITLSQNSSVHRTSSIYITVFKSRDLASYERLSRLFLNKHLIPNFSDNYTRFMLFIRTILRATSTPEEPIL